MKNQGTLQLEYSRITTMAIYVRTILFWISGSCWPPNSVQSLSFEGRSQERRECYFLWNKEIIVQQHEQSHCSLLLKQCEKHILVPELNIVEKSPLEIKLRYGTCTNTNIEHPQEILCQKELLCWIAGFHLNSCWNCFRSIWVGLVLLLERSAWKRGITGLSVLTLKYQQSLRDIISKFQNDGP